MFNSTLDLLERNPSSLSDRGYDRREDWCSYGKSTRTFNVHLGSDDRQQSQAAAADLNRPLWE